MPTKQNLINKNIKCIYKMNIDTHVFLNYDYLIISPNFQEAILKKVCQLQAKRLFHLGKGVDDQQNGIIISINTFHEYYKEVLYREESLMNPDRDSRFILQNHGFFDVTISVNQKDTEYFHSNMKTNYIHLRVIL